MPLPTAWHPVPDVGATRDQGSGATPCVHPQVGRLFRGRQFAHRQVHSLPVRHVQRGHVRDLSEDATATSLPRHAHGAGVRQCPVPPRRPPQVLAAKISRRAHPAVSAAVQSAAGSHRASLEAGSPPGNAQSVLCDLGRRADRRLHLLRSLESPQFGIAEIMRHNLRRHV